MFKPAMKPNKSLCLAVSLLAMAAGAQTNSLKTNAVSRPQIRPISLRECLDSALQHNLDVQIARISPNVVRFQLQASYGAQYDPVFSFGATKTFVDMPPVPDPKKAGVDNPYELNTVTLESGLNGKLTPGLSYNLGGYSSDFFGNTTLLSPAFDNNNPGVAPFYTVNGVLYGVASTRPDQWFQSAVGFNVKQSLLKDFWIDSGRLQIQVNKKNLKISEQGLLMQIMNTVLAVDNAYYDLVYAEENVKVMRKALDFAQELLSGDRQKVSAGTLPPLSEKLAASRVETAQANLFTAEELRDIKRGDLRNLLTDDFVRAPEEVLEPTDGLGETWTTPNRAESLQTAMDKRPDAIQARTELEKQGIIVRYAANQMFPTLDLVGMYGGMGVNDTSRSRSAGDAIGFNNPTYTVGVVLKMPLSNTEARNKHKASKELQQQALLRLKKVEQEIFLQLDNTIKSLAKVYGRIAATRQARIYAEAALDAEKQKFQGGMSTTFLVTEYERNLVTARTAEILAVVDYNKALATLAFNEGTILDKNQIKVEFQ
jgi:outer membrane protein